MNLPAPSGSENGLNGSAAPKLYFSSGSGLGVLTNGTASVMNQAGKAAINIRKPNHAISPPVTDYQSQATTMFRQDDNSQSPIRLAMHSNTLNNDILDIQ